MKKALHTSINFGATAAAVFAVSLALAGSANADSMHSAKAHKGKSGQITLATSTEVGGTLLPAGDYTVREVKSAEGEAIEFTRTVENELASELLSPYEEEVAARVEVSAKELDSTPKHTRLVLANNGRDAASLEIRGNNVDYVFSNSQMAAE